MLTIFLSGIFSLKKRNRAKVDYSFGLKTVRKVKELIEHKQCLKAETLLIGMNSEERTIAIDYVGITLGERILLHWLQKCGGSDISKLCLGVYYLHKAWMLRTHAYARDVTHEGASGFLSYLEKSLDTLTEIDENSSLAGELHSRLIRLFMSLEEWESVDEYFQKAIALDNKMIWPYIHYCEAIEPKWGGSIDKISTFMQQVPPGTTIEMAIELKLVLDSLTASENYFGGSMEQLLLKASATLESTDKTISQKPLVSIHRYIIYNYLMALAAVLSHQEIQQKYEKKVGLFYTLYPFGIIQ